MKRTDHEKRYYQEHREEILEQERRYYRDYIEQIREQHKKYYQENKERQRERCRKWRLNNIEKQRESNRKHSQKSETKKHVLEYHRIHSLGSPNLNNGKIIYGLNKRPYPDHCELCGKIQLKHLVYHHFNNNDPSLGIWLCQSMKCHGLAEALDFIETPEGKSRMNYYLNLKEILIKGLTIEEAI